MSRKVIILVLIGFVAIVVTDRVFAEFDIIVKETGNSSSINPHVYGVMTQGTYFSQGLDSREKGVYFHEDSTALSILNRLPLDNMRILGGTNTWGNSIYNKGHGYKTHCGDLLMDDVIVDCYKDEDEPRNFHFLHTNMARATNILNVVYVTNYLQPASELDSLFRYWKNEGINILAVELGNEYHLGKFRAAFPEPAVYADWAASMSDTIKQIDPTIETGVMLPKPYTVAGNRYYTEWMNELSSRYKAGTLNIDFVVCHIYQQIGDCYNGVSCDQGNACVVRRLPWTDVQSRLYIDTRYQMMKSYYYEWIPAYFPGIKIYFTEWGLKKRELGSGNTLLQAWHVVRELMEFHRANHEYNGIVGAAHFTKLLHPNTAPSLGLIQPFTISGIGIQEPNLNNSSTFIGSTEAEAFALFKPVQTGYYLETIQSKPVGMNPYIRIEMLQALDGSKYLFYANHSDSNFSVNVSGENKTMFGNWDDAGGITRCNQTSWTLPSIMTFHNDNLLRPRSVGRIKIESTGLKRESKSKSPKSYQLYQNYPNPFNPVTEIIFQIPQSGMVSLVVYNMLGEKVTTLVHDHLSAGSYTTKFDGTGLWSGVYFYAMKAGDYMQVRKCILMR